MQVVLFRHGHKDFMPPEDPSLSARGFDQAKKLATLVASHELPKPTHCWASDKIRTLQTLQDVINQTSSHSEQTKQLSIRSHQESQQQFRNRIQNFLNEIDRRAENTQHKNEIHYICTHYDWIEEAMSLINCDKDLNSYEFSSWAPAQYLIFDLYDGCWHLTKKGAVT